MTIKFVCNPVYVGGKEGWSPTDIRLGGTEESIVEWSKVLAKRGVDVIVYTNGEEVEYEGVKYCNYDKYMPGGIDINIKYSTFKHEAPAWYLTNEVDAKDLDLSRFEGVILPTKWALDNLGVVHNNIRIVPHGYDPELIYPDKKIKNQCLYASSPDRGLVNLERLWPEVVEQVPDATLIVTYGGQIDTPNTMCFGDIDEETMSELFRTSQFWLHPCTGGELYCMSGVKAQVALTVPVYYPIMALQETIRWGVRADDNTFVDKLVKVMTNDTNREWIIKHHKTEEYPTWEESTDTLLRAVNVKPWLL